MVAEQSNRYYEKQVKETLEEAGYDSDILKEVLMRFGYGGFPKAGISNNGFQKLLDLIKDIDKRESNLEKRVDVSISIKPRKIEKKRQTGKYWPVVREDLRKVIEYTGKGLGYTIVYPVGIFFAFPTTIRKCPLLEKTFLFSLAVSSFVVATPMYYISELAMGDPKRAAIVGGIQLGSNLLSGLYEYIRYVRKRAKNNQ